MTLYLDKICNKPSITIELPINKRPGTEIKKEAIRANNILKIAAAIKPKKMICFLLFHENAAAAIPIIRALSPDKTISANTI